MGDEMSLFDVAFDSYKKDALQEVKDELKQELDQKVRQEVKQTLKPALKKLREEFELQLIDEKIRIFKSLIANGYPEEEVYKIIFEDLKE